MFKAATIAIAAIGLAGAAAADTLAMQRYHAKLAAQREEPLSTLPDVQSLRARLRSEPLEPEVLRDLGMQQPGGGRTLLLLAERVSRQDPVAQLILLQSAALSGDLDATLGHYDVLLSTWPKTTPALQAQLANGLQNAEIANKVARYANRPWFPDFLAAAATMAADPRPVARLAQATGQLHASADRIVSPLLGSLLRKGYPADAFRLARAATRPDAGWTRFSLTRTSVNPQLAPLTWTMTSGAAAHAAFDEAGRLSITVDPLTTARVLQRVTDLAPGAYSLKQTVSAPASAAPMLEWRMSCIKADPPGPDWRGRISDGARPDGSSIEVTIPPGCSFQEWSLWAAGADTQTASTATIQDLSLRPR